MDVWSWITTLPVSDNWPPSNSTPLLQLVSSAAKSIVLMAERTADPEAMVTFSVCLQGFHPSINPTKTLWVSDPCTLTSSEQHPLLLQLLREVVARAPSADPIVTSSLSLVDLRFPANDTQQFSNFFSLVFLCRLFWLCACDAATEVGILYFQMLNSNLERALDCKAVMKEFLVWAGADWEVFFMRSMGYMFAKWCILRDLSSPSLPSPESTNAPLLGSLSYAADLHGLWVLRGYTPVNAMAVSHQHGHANLEVREPILRYALAHQQLEVVVQLEYKVCCRDNRFIRVGLRVDNLRIHVFRLGFGKREQHSGGEEPDAPDERHFPSRVRVWAGPDPCSPSSRHVAGLSLGRSTGNPEREVTREQTVKGNFFGGKNKSPPKVKAEARTSAREKARSWRWEQDAEGNTAVFEGVLCESSSGVEVATWRPGAGGGGGRVAEPKGGMRRRYSGAGRVFSKSGGVVVAGDELGEWVSWRVGREMEGEVLKWRLGGKVWVSYWPNEVKSSNFETRCVEWREEVELPLHVFVGGGKE